MPLRQTISAESSTLQNQVPPDSVVFGRTEQMQAMRNRFEKVLSLDMPVLIEGESGTGKDVIARMLHQGSPWMSGVFVKVRCSCIPDSLDELFEPRAEIASSQSQTNCYGTLFLDEISETNAALQTKLLRLLQEGQFCRINLKHCKLNVRLVCATSCDLDQIAAHGSFRRDLLYRINVLTLRIPPLRDRIVDIPDLVNYFLDLFGKAYACRVKRLSRTMLQSLRSYSWPGNIRELENLMKRYVLFGCDEAICNELVSTNGNHSVAEVSERNPVSLKELTKKAVRELERETILKVLHANHWNRKRAASELNISYRALLYKLKSAGLAPSVAPSGGRLAS